MVFVFACECTLARLCRVGEHPWRR